MKNIKSSLEEFIRRLVIATNAFWPFSYLNRLPYYLAIKAFIVMCKKFPQIKAIYTIHGLVKDNWIPALSDIDLVVVTDYRLAADEEYSFLDLFWERYRRIKRIFPMIGEIIILHDREISMWTKYSVLGHEFLPKKLLYGIGTSKEDLHFNPDIYNIYSTNSAVETYLSHLMPLFYKNGGLSYSDLLLVKRAAAKIIKQTGAVDNIVLSKEDAYSYILGFLEDNVRRYILEGDKNSEKINIGACLYDDPSSYDTQTNVEELNEQIAKMSPWHEVIESILFVFDEYPKIFIVLKEDADPKAVRACMDGVKNIFMGQKIKPLIVSHYVFRYILLFQNPLTYVRLIKTGKVLYGRNIMPEITQPSRHLFLRRLLICAVDILMYPQREYVIRPPHPLWFSGEGYYFWFLAWLIRFRLYAEKGVIDIRHNNVLFKEWGSYYPSCFEKIEELKKSIAENKISEKELNKELFIFLRCMAGEVYSYVAANENNLNLEVLKI